MPYLEVDLDAFKGAQLAAGVLGLPVPQVIGGLNLLWAHAWQRREDHVAGIILEGLFASANPRLGEALEAAGFLERDGETWRVRGCERYLRISEARRKGAAATNAKRALQRQSSDAGATLERRSTPSHRSTDSPTHRSKIKDSSAAADALAAAGSRGPTRVPGEAGADPPPPSEAASPAPVLPTEQLAAAVDGYRAEALAEVEAVAEALPALVPPTEQLAGAPQATEGPWLPRQCKSVSGLPPGGGPDEIVAPGGSQGPLERSLREPDAAEEAVALWNSLAGVDLPRVTKLTPGRRKAIKAALALVPLSDWPKAIAAVKAWPWRGDDGTWRPDLDWLLATNRNRTPNILRAAEGALSGKAKPDPRRGIQRVEDQGWDQYPIEAGGKP